jgi:hypothetical protein
MKLNHLLVLIFVFTLSASLHARKPAVEDFVGVETEGYEKTPKGTEVLFDFGNQLAPVQSQNLNVSSKIDINSFSSFMLIAFATLPFIMWFGINQSVKEQKAVNTTQTPPATASKVEKLDDYRKSSSSKTEDDDEKDKLAG